MSEQVQPGKFWRRAFTVAGVITGLGISRHPIGGVILGVGGYLVGKFADQVEADSANSRQKVNEMIIANQG